MFCKLERGSLVLDFFPDRILEAPVAEIRLSKGGNKPGGRGRKNGEQQGQLWMTTEIERLPVRPTHFEWAHAAHLLLFLGQASQGHEDLTKDGTVHSHRTGGLCIFAGPSASRGANFARWRLGDNVAFPDTYVRRRAISRPALPYFHVRLSSPTSIDRIPD